MKTVRCVLKPGREKPVQAFHPWIFSGAIDLIDEGYQAGDLVRVLSADEKFLGTGYLNPQSQITVRMLAFDERAINADFFREKIKAAVALRSAFIPPKVSGYRLIHSEGDFLPGLIVERYGDFLVSQFLTAGMTLWKEALAELLKAVPGIKGLYERSDAEALAKEGLEPNSGVLWGAEPPELVPFEESGFQFFADVREGQKSGFFFDQRDNRALIGGLCRGKNVLNCFSYSGAFSVYAAGGGAKRVVSVDSSADAIDMARVHLEKNGFAAKDFPCLQDDVFRYLREDDSAYDVIILDPPAFCKRKDQVTQAARGYKDINLLAFKKLVPGGLLFTASCSSFIDLDLFQKIIFGAAKDAGRPVRILKRTGHGADHPVSIYHPEGEYLKGILCQAL